MPPWPRRAHGERALSGIECEASVAGDERRAVVGGGVELDDSIGAVHERATGAQRRVRASRRSAPRSGPDVAFPGRVGPEGHDRERATPTASGAAASAPTKIPTSRASRRRSAPARGRAAPRRPPRRARARPTHPRRAGALDRLENDTRSFRAAPRSRPEVSCSKTSSSSSLSARGAPRRGRSGRPPDDVAASRSAEVVRPRGGQQRQLEARRVRGRQRRDRLLRRREPRRDTSRGRRLSRRRRPRIRAARAARRRGAGSLLAPSGGTMSRQKDGC